MITSEKELQDELVIHLTEQGFNCQEYVPNSVGIADIVIDNAVIELKHLPNREALFKAIGQAVLYRGAIDRNLDAKIICSYYDEALFLRLQSASIAVKQFGIELIPWVVGDSLVFQTDSIYTLPNIYKVGDICLISSLCQLKLMEYNKCWAIVTEVSEYGCKLQLWDGQIFIRTQHLKKLDLGIEQSQILTQVSNRVSSLSISFPNLVVSAALKALFRQTCFSADDLWLLEQIEQRFQVTLD